MSERRIESVAGQGQNVGKYARNAFVKRETNGAVCSEHQIVRGKESQ